MGGNEVSMRLRKKRRKMWQIIRRKTKMRVKCLFSEELEWPKGS